MKNSYNETNYKVIMEQSNGNEQKGMDYAIASMILGMASLLFCCIWIISFSTSVVGLILSITSLRQNRKGKGFAIAGLVLCSVAFLLNVIFQILGFTVLYIFDI